VSLLLYYPWSELRIRRIAQINLEWSKISEIHKSVEIPAYAEASADRRGSTIYDIVKAHGGEISLNSDENEGTEFTVVLPV